MRCPKCNGTLSKMTIRKTADYGGDLLDDAEVTDKIVVDQCLSCTGIWFDVDELDQYLAEKLVILDSKKPENYNKVEKQEANCPKCDKLMEKHTAPKKAGFKVDTCPECHGVWLDGSELDHLERRNFSIGQKLILEFSYLKALSKGK